MRWAVNNANAGNENLHLYLFTTNSPDVSRGKNVPTCTEDCFGFTYQYLLGNGTFTQ